jgi:hypothetical protein
MKGRELKRIWGHSWDYGYLLVLEQRKLKEMAEYFKKSKRLVGWEFQVRDCELCVKLLDIVMEKDPYYNSWLHQAYGDLNFENKQVKFPVYVNVKNAERFWKGFNQKLEDYSQKQILEAMKSHLRSEKAFHLYHKIRMYRMRNWWD